MGATYIPLEEMLPPLAAQVTDVLLVPMTLAANCWLPPKESDAAPGATETETTGALTVTVAEADLVVSATLVDVTA